MEQPKTLRFRQVKVRACFEAKCSSKFSDYDVRRIALINKLIDGLENEQNRIMARANKAKTHFTFTEAKPKAQARELAY